MPDDEAAEVAEPAPVEPEAEEAETETDAPEDGGGTPVIEV